jgi:hypothetical protein
MSAASPARSSVLGGLLGALLGAITAGPIAGIVLFVAGMLSSVQIDEAQGHPGGESDAGFVALFTVFGSIGIAIVFAVAGAIIGAVAGAVRLSVLKWTGVGALIGAAIPGIPLLLWASSLISSGDRVFPLTALAIGALAGLIAGATAGAVGGFVGVWVRPRNSG